MEKDVLLGQEPTELEILEFKAGGNAYCVNISDIKEILTNETKPTPVPNSHPFIEGIIKPRDFLIPIINLSDSLKLTNRDDKKGMIIVTGISDQNIGFHVGEVSGIFKINRTEIAKPGKKLSTSQKDVIKGILTHDNRKIEMVDLRKTIMIINSDVQIDKVAI